MYDVNAGMFRYLVDKASELKEANARLLAVARAAKEFVEDGTYVLDDMGLRMSLLDALAAVEDLL